MSQLSEEDYEAAYRVLEAGREDVSGVNEAMMNDAHYRVQLHEAENQ